MRNARSTEGAELTSGSVHSNPVSPLFEPAAGAQATHCALSIVGRTRFVVPSDSGVADRGLSVFLPTHQRALLKCHRWWLSLGNGVESVYFQETDLLRDMKAFLGLQPVHTLLSVGVPGPYTKNTVVFINRSGAVGPIVKVGVSPAAIDLLQNEAQWLDRLGRNPALASYVPLLLWSGKWHGVQVLAQSCAEGRRAGRRLSPSLRQFLNRLQTSEPRRQGFTESRMHLDMRRRYAELRPGLSPVWGDTIEQTLAELESELAGADVPMVTAHRDFTRWNVRHRREGVLVFDWEYASNGYLRDYDFFHYHFQPLACGREWRGSDLQSALALARKVISALPRVNGALPTFLLLAYLLDVSLTYLEAASGQDTRVVRNYRRLIDALGQQSDRERVRGRRRWLV